MPLKTPLPEKSQIDRKHDELVSILSLEETINQLITYLAELTEVVEGKQWVANAEEFLAPLNPTLKERLLEEIKNEPDYQTGLIKKERIEAIINRLIP